MINTFGVGSRLCFSVFDCILRGVSHAVNKAIISEKRVSDARGGVVPEIKEVREEESIFGDPIRNKVIFMVVISAFRWFDNYRKVIRTGERDFGEYSRSGLSFSSVVNFVDGIMSE